jgi:hypothetical protein
MTGQRAKVAHYMVWAHELGPLCAGTGGVSEGIPHGNFLVSLGAVPDHGSESLRRFVFTHELGHNLGLGHGGVRANGEPDHHLYKPNHPSVMNYLYTEGVPLAGGGRYEGYSRHDLMDLNEAMLAEPTGVPETAAGVYWLRFYCPLGGVEWRSDPRSGVDWDCDGRVKGTVAANVDGGDQCDPTPRAHCLLSGSEEWTRLRFTGGIVGTADAPSLPDAIASALGIRNEIPSITPKVDELTPELYAALRFQAAP